MRDTLAKREDLGKKLRRNKPLVAVVSFVLGAIVLGLFSVLQKLIMHEPALILQLRDYAVPVVYGGATGLVLGLWYFRLKQKESELLEAYNAILKG